MNTISTPLLLNTKELSPVAVGAFIHWWHGISSPEAGGMAKADRAQLKRCDTLTAVTLQPAFHRAYKAMSTAQFAGHLSANVKSTWQGWQQNRLAVLVGVAVHVKTASKRNLAQEMGRWSEGGDRACVSELRFKRLMESHDNDSFFIGLRRVMPLIGHQVDLGSLARDLFQWNDAIRRRWAYAYYDTPSKALKTD